MPGREGPGSPASAGEDQARVDELVDLRERLLLPLRVGTVVRRRERGAPCGGGAAILDADVPLVDVGAVLGDFNQFGEAGVWALVIAEAVSRAATEGARLKWNMVHWVPPGSSSCWGPG